MHDQPHKSAQPSDAAASQSSWSLRTKVVASILFAAHIFAVFAAPSAAPPPASYSWNWLAGRIDGREGLISPYLRAVYIKHGYRFFAPNPGPSHLVRFEIDLRGGGQIEGHFPNTEDQFPRLLYHRMFMISETAFNLASPVSEIPAAGTLNELERIEFDKQLAAANELAKSISRRLLREHDGRSIRLYLVTHEIPFPGDVVRGQQLNDPSLYVEQPWREYSEEQL